MKHFSFAKIFLLSAVILMGALALHAAEAAFDEKPVPLKTPPPKYPSQMRSEGVEGMVAVRVFIAVDGSVKSCEVAKSNRPEFEQPALEAVQKWKFKPAKKDGEPVECKIVIPIRFSAGE